MSYCICEHLAVFSWQTQGLPAHSMFSTMVWCDASKTQGCNFVSQTPHPNQTIVISVLFSTCLVCCHFVFDLLGMHLMNFAQLLIIHCFLYPIYFCDPPLLPSWDSFHLHLHEACHCLLWAPGSSPLLFPCCMLAAWDENALHWVCDPKPLVQIATVGWYKHWKCAGWSEMAVWSLWWLAKTKQATITIIRISNLLELNMMDMSYLVIFCFCLCYSW